MSNMVPTMGIDSASRISESALLTLQPGFVCRYLQSPGGDWKALTTAEVVNLRQREIPIVSIWETDPTYPEFFTSERGQLEGTRALTSAVNIGQPIESAIYATVDYDARPEHMDAIAAYLTAFSDAIKPYHLGVYGGYAVIEHMANLTPYLWQTYAWSNNKLHKRAVLYQLKNSNVADFDAALSQNIGAWGAVLQPVAPILQLGSRGAYVYVLQALINAATGTNIAVDGAYGPITDAAVHQFQARAGLPFRGVDTQTWLALCATVHPAPAANAWLWAQDLGILPAKDAAATVTMADLANALFELAKWLKGANNV